jgi:hypothetical protein
MIALAEALAMLAADVDRMRPRRDIPAKIAWSAIKGGAELKPASQAESESGGKRPSWVKCPAHALPYPAVRC